MDCTYACRSPEHLSRRSFLQGATAGALGTLGFQGMVRAEAASSLSSQQKRVVVFWFSGGVSQLETWDPKPGTDTGGPFQTIPTSVPGLHICELLPYTATQMHSLAVIRGLNTAEDDHSKGRYIMETGRRKEPAQDYPHLGAVCAKLLGSADRPLPGHIHITPKGEGGYTKGDSAFLGPKYASVSLGDGKPPANLLRPAALSEQADHQRNAFRELENAHFLARRRTAETEAYTHSYEQAAQIMERRSVFDISREAPRYHDHYGTHDFGRHCLLARRLLENGVTFVR